MVVFKVGDDYYTNVLKTFGELRKNGKHDFIITVLDRQIYCHKSVLAAGCDFFKSLFLSEEKKSLDSIDISDRIEDYTTIEQVVDFLYKGEIEINDGNVKSLMKIAAVLKVKNLPNFFEDFVTKTFPDLNSSFEFYLLALNLEFPNIEEKLSMFILSRFHDLYLHKTEALELTPKEIEKLVDKGCFKFCMKSAILDFLVRWFDHQISAVSDDHLNIVFNLLEYLKSRDNDLGEADVEKDSCNCRKGLEKLSDCVKKTNCSGKKLCIEKLATFMKDVESKGLKSMSCDPQGQEYEKIILTISPRQCVIRYEDNWESDDCERFPNQYDCPVLDICAYLPGKGSWLLLDQVYDFDVYYWIIRMDGLMKWYYTCKGRKLYCIFSEGSEISYKVNMDEFSNCKSLKDPGMSRRPLEMHGSGRYLASSSDKNLYLIQKFFNMKMKSGKLTYETSFQCCKYIASTRSWNEVYTTPVVDLTNDYGNVLAALSPDGKEMLMILYFRARIICSFAASLGDGDPSVEEVYPTRDMSEEEINRDMSGENMSCERYRTIKIVEGQDKFLVIGFDYREDNPTLKARCLYEYKFRSGTLISVDRPVVSISDYSYIFSTSGHPCFSFKIVSDRQSVWVFSGNKKGASSLTEIKVDENGNLRTQEHTPPPFSCVTALIPTEVEASYLTCRDSADKYLLSDDEEV